MLLAQGPLIEMMYPASEYGQWRKQFMYVDGPINVEDPDKGEHTGNSQLLQQQ